MFTNVAAALSMLPTEPFSITFSPSMAALILAAIWIYRKKG